MANVKITDLQAGTNPASTDVLPFVDISSDETKKVTIADLLENAGDGSASAPAFGFDSDPGLGMFRTGNDALAFATGETGRLFIDSAGQIGIGATNPGGKLHVESAATTAGWQFRTDSVGLSNESGFYRDASDNYELVLRNGAGGLSFLKNDGGTSTANLSFTVQGSEALRIDSSGNVGVATSDPKFYLQVNNFGGLDGNGNQLILSNNVYYDGGNKTLKTGFSNRIELTNSDGSIRFLNTAASSSANASIATRAHAPGQLGQAVSWHVCESCRRLTFSSGQRYC